jgi:hypothetical protein
MAPPSGVQFSPGCLALGTNATAQSVTTELEVFAINAKDGSVWTNQQIDANAAVGWAGWTQMPANPMVNGKQINFLPTPAELTLPKTLAVATNQTGALEVFAIGNDGNPYHIWQVPAAASGWAQWTPMTAPGSAVLSLDVARFNGQLVVVYFAGGSVFYDYQSAPASGPWQSEASGNVQQVALPAESKGLFLGTLINADGVQLTAEGQPGMGYYINFLRGLGGTPADWQGWSAQTQPTQTPGGWVGLPGSVSPPVGAYPDNEWLAMFNTDQNGNLAGIKFVVKDGWANFIAYAGPAKGQTKFQQDVLALATLPIVFNQPPHGGIGVVDTQYLMAFLVDSATQKTVWNVPIRGDDVADSEAASAPVQVGISGGAVSAIAVGTNADGRLEVFALESENQCSHWWQNAAGTAP